MRGRWLVVALVLSPILVIAVTAAIADMPPPNYQPLAFEQNGATLGPLSQAIIAAAHNDQNSLRYYYGDDLGGFHPAHAQAAAWEGPAHALFGTQGTAALPSLPPVVVSGAPRAFGFVPSSSQSSGTQRPSVTSTSPLVAPPAVTGGPPLLGLGSSLALATQPINVPLTSSALGTSGGTSASLSGGPSTGGASASSATLPLAPAAASGPGEPNVPAASFGGPAGPSVAPASGNPAPSGAGPGGNTGNGGASGPSGNNVSGGSAGNSGGNSGPTGSSGGNGGSSGGGNPGSSGPIPGGLPPAVPIQTGGGGGGGGGNPGPTRTPTPTTGGGGGGGNPTTPTPTPTPGPPLPANCLIMTNDHTGQPLFHELNLEPGDSRQATVTLGNAGCLAFDYSLSITGAQESLGIDPTYGLQLQVVRVSDGASLYQGPLLAQTGTLGVMQPGDHVQLRLVVSLPYATGNAFQAQALTVSIVWTATSV